MCSPTMSRECKMLTARTANNAIRWKEGERLDHLYERRCDELAPGHLAVIAEDAEWTFRDLDVAANQIARYLLANGLGSGDRIGLLFDKGSYTYAAMLAVLKINAAYVPLDAGFPNERIQFITTDAEIKAIVSMAQFEAKLDEIDAPKIYVDADEAAIRALPSERLSAEEKGPATDELAYIIYTSGTTGNPKGVAIEHANICNFVAVAAEVYGISDSDRMFQGMTIAFDFSVEELWVPLIAGAALVPGQKGATLVGEDLADYLDQKGVTALACVPTLLATIERDLPKLRVLLVSGEACPHDLVLRWSKPGRSILNAYGPTEATVTCTLTELIPDKPVTIGGPLPTYTIVILDEHQPREIADGGMGEIGVAGVGLARGYVNRDDLTAQKFIPDFLDIENNPSKRIYRTGDLGRINENQEIEFHGRIDTQVKIRGYRIELTEIESVILDAPGVAQAAVMTHESEPGSVELAAYFSATRGEEVDRAELFERLKNRLPGYMVPAYLEQLPLIPMTLQHKADRKKLPAPSGPRFTGAANPYVAPTTEIETAMAEVLGAILKVDRVSVEDDFFCDLGAHSLLMARFCTEMRKRHRCDISMRDVYAHTTIKALAAAVESAPSQTVAAKTRETPHVASDFAYYGCGALQLAYYLFAGALGLGTLVLTYEWLAATTTGPVDLYLRTVALGVAFFTFFTALPVAAKWLLIGRFKREVIPVWSLAYFRFWLVKQLTRATPLAAFVGYPLYNVYLRLLGAKIGPGSVIMSRVTPVTADLLSIGAHTIIRKDTVMPGYKARAGRIYTGPISIGDNAFVGEGSVIDIDTRMGDDAQLAHASSLHEGQSIPAGERWHGSPARKADADFCGVPQLPPSGWRRLVYSTLQLLTPLLLAPIPILILDHLFPTLLPGPQGAEPSAGGQVARDRFFDVDILAIGLQLAPITLGLLVFGLIAGLLSIWALPRFWNLFLEEGKVYPLYGVRYYTHRLVSRISNSKAYNLIFGDSSYIIGYLRWIGYKLNTVHQTGSNFGTSQIHENPFLCDIGSGTMVSDGLSMMNAEISATSFHLSKVKLGDHNYLGNDIHYPPHGKTGENVLFGTKTLIPVDGPVRENIGLLGSPCFEIPRATNRDASFLLSMTEEKRLEQLAAKNRHNLVTMGLYLFVEVWFLPFLMLWFGTFALVEYPFRGVWPLALFGLGSPFLFIGYSALVERASTGFKPLQPQVVSIYDPYFRFHERHWKLSSEMLPRLFIGTPFKNVISRLLGVKVGRKVFDDGCSFVERTMITVDEYATLNAASEIQCHSLEEGVFKSDRIRIGSGATVGAAALVHYGVDMGAEVDLAPGSFLMKGEAPEPKTIWKGNPAVPAREAAAESEALVPAVEAAG